MMYKRFCALFLSLTVIILGGLSAVVFAVDPFSHYRTPDDCTKIIYQIPFYQNVGIAEHADFDTLITGSSMTQNFRANRFNDKLGCNALRLSFDGGSIFDFDILLSAALKGNKVKTVYFGIDNYNLTNETSNLKLETKIPKYLYDSNPFNDVNYLLNKDVIFKYLRTYFSYKFSDSYDFYEMHAWDRNPSYVFSKQSVLNRYDRPKVCANVPEDNYRLFNEKATEILIKHISENPQTRFIFFSPPYSILYWDSIKRQGKLDATLNALAYSYEKLLEYDNVELFYFQNDEKTVENLDNYRDYSHYCTAVNEYMLDCFIDGTHSVTAGEVDACISEMKAIVNNYDFDSLFSESVS